MAPTLGTSTRDPKVLQMFDELSPHYDLVNHVITLGQAVQWRNRLVDQVPHGGRVLDYGCGTGDLMIEILRRGGADRVVGFDMARGMLALARKRLARASLGERARLARGDGEKLPFRDASFDAVVSSFVMRNVGDRAKAYREIARVLKPGGRYLQLEMARPRNRYLRTAFLVYFQHLMPWLGGLVSGDRAPFQYLSESLDRWPHQDQVGRDIRAQGFFPVTLRELGMGTVAIHTAIREAQ